MAKRDSGSGWLVVQGGQVLGVHRYKMQAQKEAQARRARGSKFDAVISVRKVRDRFMHGASNPHYKRNPPKMRRISKSTGWMSARRIKIVKRGRHIGLLVEKPRHAGKKKAKKKGRR